MISSQLRHAIPEFDEIVREDVADFADSGLKTTSVIRIGRLTAVQGDILLGATGQIAPDRLQRIKRRLTEWLARS
jgi:mRNA interferase MazF